jgi:hypothetical protein
MKSGIATYIRPCHFISVLSRKESGCDRKEQRSDIVSRMDRANEALEESQVLPWLSKAEQLIGHITGLVEGETN